MFISENMLRKKIRKILNEVEKNSNKEGEQIAKSDNKKNNNEEKLIKIGVYKTKEESIIGGSSYMSFQKGNVAFALDSDGVLYKRKKGSGEDYDPIDDKNELKTLTDDIINNNNKSGFVNKVKDEMIKRVDQLESQNSEELKRLLNKYFSYLKGGDPPYKDQVWLRWPFESKELTPAMCQKLSARWSKLISDYKQHMTSKGFPNSIKANGARRDMKESYTSSNPARTKGTNHGLALACDITLEIPSIKSGYVAVTDNYHFANNEKFVKATQEFADKNPDLKWGGTFTSKNSYNPKKGINKITGRGKTEIHHWELKSSEYSKYIDSDFNTLLSILNKRTGCGIDISTESKRIPIYEAIYTTFQELFPYKDVKWGDKSSWFGDDINSKPGNV